MFKFSLVIPVYNEDKNLNFLLDEITSCLDINEIIYEIIVVNDFSNDNTKQILFSKKNKIKNLVIINNSKNLGQSESILIGVKSSKYNTIVTMDGDGQNSPKDISILLLKFFSDENLKLVSGIRRKRQDSIIKIISSKIANKIRKTILNDNCDDTGCSLKVFDKNIFLSFEFFNGIHRFIPALFGGYGYKAAFLEVEHRSRKYGFSKYGVTGRLFKGIVDMIRVYKIINKRKK